MTRKSLIFSDGDLKEIERRLAGDYDDENGTFSSRTKPKIRELLDVWVPRLNDLYKIMEKKR